MSSEKPKLRELSNQQTAAKHEWSSSDIKSSLKITPNIEKNPPVPETSHELLDELEMNEQERKLVQHLMSYDFSKDFEQVWTGLNRKELEYIKKLKLEPEQVELILNGDTTFSEMAALNSLTPFEQRARQDRKFQKETNKNERDWEFGEGDEGRRHGGPTTIYKISSDDEFYERASKLPEGLNVADLIGAELTYADSLKQLLAEKKEGDAPVIALDIGGMVGKSWYRLAHHFKKEVKEGKIVFMITSLGRDIHELLDQAENGLNPHQLTKTVTKFIRHNKNLVDYRKADIADLFKGEIEVNGKTFPIMGNVGLMNDANAVALHGMIPSAQMPMMAGLLAEKAIWFSETTSTDNFSKSTKYTPDARNIELRRAREMTQHYLDLEKVNQVEGGSEELVGKEMKYYIMRTQGGPKVNAFLPEDRF